MLELLSPPSALPGLEIRALTAVAFTAAAAYYDLFNRKWVPDSVAYSCLLLAAALNIIFFNPVVFAQSLLIGGGVFAATYLIYKAGQLGGADVFVLSGIAAALPFLPSPFLAPHQSVPYPFIFSVMVPTGLVFIAHMLARFIPYISRRIAQGKVKFTSMQLVEAAALIISLGAFSFVLSTASISLPPVYLAVFSFLAVSLLFFSIFKSEIKESMVEVLPSSRLCAEDVLALEKIDKKTIKALSLSPTMDAAMIARIKKARIKALPVYTGMPFFLPYLLFGLVFALLFGDLFFYLL